MEQTRVSPPKISATLPGYPLALLTIVYVLNFVDRQVVNIVAEPIKHEYGLADWQLGALTGLSFAVLYTVCGFPIARWAERGDRSRIIALAVIAWSAMTALCGVAQNFTQFALARVGVGLGEAGCTPPAQSLIADIVARDRHASALAIYAMGAPLGQLIGMAMGGFVAARFGWRSVFFVAAAPGVVVALLALFTLPEPRRTAAGRVVADSDAPGFWSTIGFFLTNRSFMLVAGGGAAASFVFYGVNSFAAPFFLRNHAAELANGAQALGIAPLAFLGLALGLSGGVAGVCGALIGGRIADRWARRDGAAHVLFPAICTLLAAPMLAAAMLVAPLFGAIALLALAAGLNAAWNGAAYAAALGVAPPRSRATASALLMFIFNLVGLGLGPLCVGLLSDAFAPSLGAGGGLRVAMAVAASAGLVATACFWAARTRLERDTIG